jgi:hypothetical protein
MPSYFCQARWSEDVDLATRFGLMHQDRREAEEARYPGGVSL